MISWDDYFLEMLEVVKKRSPDSQTQVACIITENNRIRGVGYNGWPAGINNLPDKRPEKYKWMVHADVNAIINCNGPVTNPKAYLTYLPCHKCLGLMWNFGIRSIIIPGNMTVFTYTDEDYEVLGTLIRWGLQLQLGDESVDWYKIYHGCRPGEITQEKILLYTKQYLTKPSNS